MKDIFKKKKKFFLGKRLDVCAKSLSYMIQLLKILLFFFFLHRRFIYMSYWINQVCVVVRYKRRAGQHIGYQSNPRETNTIVIARNIQHG